MQISPILFFLIRETQTSSTSSFKARLFGTEAACWKKVFGGKKKVCTQTHTHDLNAFLKVNLIKGRPVEEYAKKRRRRGKGLHMPSGLY